MKKVLLLLSVIIFCISGCKKNPTGSEIADYSISFEKVWNDFDEIYSYFIHKNINWDSIKTVYEPLVQDEISYNSFIYTVLRPMLTELRDLHVSLIDKNGIFIPLYIKQCEINFSYDKTFYDRYLTNIATTSNEMFTMATINDSIGYILIYNWNNENEEDVNEFHQIFDDDRSIYENYKGIIIDVRPNGGGNELLARSVAGRFSTSAEIYAYRKSRNGPNHDDFTELQAATFLPYGSWQYTKPVILLIGKTCMSSNEAFILMMSTLEHVTTIGDTTIGSSANPREYSLRDGTEYRISSWVAYKKDTTVLEDVGIFPDITIDASLSIIDGRDMVLERAIEILQN